MNENNSRPGSRRSFAIGTSKNLYGRGPEAPKVPRSTGKAPKKQKRGK